MTSIVSPTLADLDAAPTRSRLVVDYGYGVKTVLHKRSDGDWVYGTNLDWAYGLAVNSRGTFGNFGRSGWPISILRHPAPVWVANIYGWLWLCGECDDCDWFPRSQHSAAMDAARAHAATHAGGTA